MVKIKFADLHCDTATKIFDLGNNLYENSCQVDIKKLSVYDSVIQFFAIWLDKKYLNSPFINTCRFINNYKVQVQKYKKYLSNMRFFLSIEGGEALEDNLDNLKIFHQMGVSVLTLTWNNENNLGGGTNSECGLKKFGYQVVELMEHLGMIIDISHANKKTFWDTYNFSKGTLVASHSNCWALCKNKRNLDDDQILAIKERNGLIGINLYSYFINEEGTADLKDVTKIVDYLLKLIGSKNICFGCDFDGADKFPSGVNDVSDMKKPYNLFKELYGTQITNQIFYQNICDFISRCSLHSVN